MSSARHQLLTGVQQELPIALGVIPFGLIYGVLALEAGLGPTLAQAMSSIVFAGSAQFIGAQLFRLSTPGLFIVATTLVVNLRHLLYSLALGPRLRHLSGPWRWLLAYLLTDEAFAVTSLHYENDQPLTDKHWFFLGAGLTLWLAWQASTVMGIFLGAQVPASWSLDFTLALTFIGLVVPAMKDRPVVGAVLAAGAVAVLAQPLPYRLGLMVAALVGIGVGTMVERRM